MDTAQSSANIHDLSSRQSIGTTLRAAREAQGLSAGDLAQRTKFSIHQVEALEADDFSKLPQGTFLRGFVRSYARALQLDEQSLLELLPVRVDEVAPTVVRASKEVLPSGAATQRNNVLLFGGALFVAALLAAFVWNYRDTPAPSSSVVEEVKLPVVEGASSPAIVSSVEPASSMTATAEVPRAKESPAEKTLTLVGENKPEKRKTDTSQAAVKLGEPASVVPSKTESKQPEKVVAKVPEVAPPVAVKPDVALELLKKRPIHVVFVEDVWMEIVDTNGEVLLSRTNRAGSEKWIGGGRRAPYEVSIGKVGAVHIYYKGREVDLTHFDPAKDANLVLE